MRKNIIIIAFIFIILVIILVSGFNINSFTNQDNVGNISFDNVNTSLNTQKNFTISRDFNITLASINFKFYNFYNVTSFKEDTDDNVFNTTLWTNLSFSTGFIPLFLEHDGNINISLITDTSLAGGSAIQASLNIYGAEWIYVNTSYKDVTGGTVPNSCIYLTEYPTIPIFVLGENSCTSTKNVSVLLYNFRSLDGAIKQAEINITFNYTERFNYTNIGVYRNGTFLSNFLINGTSNLYLGFHISVDAGGGNQIERLDISDILFNYGKKRLVINTNNTVFYTNNSINEGQNFSVQLNTTLLNNKLRDCIGINCTIYLNFSTNFPSYLQYSNLSISTNDILPPRWQLNQSNTSGLISLNNDVQLNITWYDFNLSSESLEINCTGGGLKNLTRYNVSGNNITLSFNVTVTDTTNFDLCRYRFYANDSSGNTNMTDIFYFLVINSAINIPPSIGSPKINTSDGRNITDSIVQLFNISQSDANYHNIVNNYRFFKNNISNHTRFIDNNYLILYLPFDYDKEDYALDNTVTQKNSGIPQLTQYGKIGGAYNFTGINDGINTESWNVSSRIGFYNNFTILLWAKPFDVAPSPSDDYLITFTDGVSTSFSVSFVNRVAISDYDNSQYNISINYRNFSDSTTTNSIITEDNYNLSDWVHIAVISNHTNLSLFVDGNYLLSVTTEAKLLLTTQIAVGGIDWGFNGTIDEILLYNRSLSNNEIRSIYLGTKDGFGIFNTTYKPNDIIIGEMIAYDIYDNSSAINSTSLLIIDVSPYWSNNQTNISNPIINSSVQINITWTDDGELSSETLEMNCTNPVNTTYSVSGTDITLSYNLTVNNTKDFKTCQYRFHANDTSGNTNTSDYNTFSIVNTIPNLTVSIIPSPVLVSNDLNCTITYHDNNNDTWLYNQTEWYNNSILASQLTNLTSVSNTNTSSSQNWTCQARVHDGYNYSDWINSSTINIDDTAEPIITDIKVTSTSITQNTNIEMFFNCTDVSSSIQTTKFWLYSFLDDGATFDNNITGTLIEGSQYRAVKSATSTGIWGFRGASCTDSSGNIFTNNSVNINISVTAVSAGGSPSSGGGGSSTPTTIPPTLNLTQFIICGNSVCDEGESTFNCNVDCPLNLDVILSGDILNQAWAIRIAIILLFTIPLLLIFRKDLKRILLINKIKKLSIRKK